MPYVGGVDTTHTDLKSFALWVREKCPKLMYILVGTGGSKLVWDGMMDLVEEIGYPGKIEKTDKISATLEALIPYIEAYSEATDCSKYEGKEQKI